MSKRGAERQLTDRNCDRDDDDEGSESGPFAAAAPEVVATRKIRGLPARKAAAAPAPTPEATKNPFGGSSGGAFGGFGAAPAATNPFAVLSTAPASSASGSTPSSGTSSPFSSFSFGAGSAPAAAAIAPTFSFPSTKTAAAAPSNTFPGAPAFSFPTTKALSSGPPVLTYYMSLRSLNLSYLDALKAQVEKDPFFKINALAGARGALDERYEKHWQEVTNALEVSKGKGKAPAPAAKAVDKAPAPFISIEVTPPVPDVTMAAPEPTPSTSAAPVAASPAPFVPIPFNWAAATGGAAPEPVVAAPPAPPKFSLPAPPTGAFKWGDMDVPKPSTSAAPVTGGFVLKPIEADPYAEKSAFTFPPAAAATVSVPSTAESKKAADSKKPTSIAIPPAVAKLANAPASPSPLRQAESVSPPAEQPSSTVPKDAAPAPKAAFSFGAAFGGIAKGDSSSSTPAAAPKTNPSTVSFGSAAAPSSPSTTPSFSFGSATAPKPIAANPFTAGASSTAFGFGTPSQPKAIQKPLGSPPITTSFGSGASPPTFGFGAALASKPPPAQPFAAGFSFGFSSTTPAPSTSAPVKVTTGFAFGAAPTPPAVVSEPMSTASSIAGGSTAGEETAPEGVDLPVQASGLTGRGEGEEGEKVLHEVRAKVWAFVRAFKDGDWDERGVATVSIKEREDDGKKRILARNAVNGNVLINFRLQPGMTVKMEKTFLTFMGFEGTTPMNFRLRIKTPADTAEMKSQLEAHAGPK